MDRAEDIADPGIRDRTLKPYRSLIDAEGFFNYLPENASDLGRYKQADSHINLIKNTYHGLLWVGYKKLNLSEDKNEYDTINVSNHAELFTRATPEEISSLVYTSGTTGRPKGAILTQANIIWTSYAMRTRRLIPEASPRNFHGKPIKER